MDYTIYKFNFTTGVLFGSGSLSNGGSAFSADRLFSALSQEALKADGEQGVAELVRLAREDLLAFSDGLPFLGSRYFIPKPWYHFESEHAGESSEKKAYKQLGFIPSESLGKYLKGSLDARAVVSELKQLGAFSLRTQAAMLGLEETLPYNLEVFNYQQGNGLYVVVACGSAEAGALVDRLMESLSYSGIGGKLSSGLGKFRLKKEVLPGVMLKALENAGSATVLMSLSVSLPKEDEMAQVIPGASYGLVKKSGFVQSENFDTNQRRKKDLFCFLAGSCFGKKFSGDVFDVSLGGAHPVYRYAKPLFMEVL